MNGTSVSSIPIVYARPGPGGSVVAFHDEAMSRVAATWSHYATNKPDMRQRYLSINHQSFKVLWRK